MFNLPASSRTMLCFYNLKYIFSHTSEHFQKRKSLMENIFLAPESFQNTLDHTFLTTTETSVPLWRTLMNCSSQHVSWIERTDRILWKFAITLESAFSSCLSLLSQGPCRGWIDNVCMTWFQEKVSLSNLYTPFILPLPPSLVPEILLAKDTLSFHNQRANSPGEECDDIWSQEAIDGCRDHQSSEYLRSERRHLEEGLGA